MKTLALLLAISLATPALAAPSRISRNAPSPEPETSQTAEVPTEVELTINNEVRRFRLIPATPEPRTQEYDGSEIQALPNSAPAVPGQRLDALMSIAGILIPIIAGFAGGSVAPKLLSVLGVIQGVRKQLPAPTEPTDPTVVPNSSIGIVRVAEVLKQLAPIIEALSKGVGNAETKTDTE